MSADRPVGRLSQLIDTENFFDPSKVEPLEEFVPFDDEADPTPRGPPGGRHLRVVDLDMCKSMNVVPHQTEAYVTPHLVVRRGHPFVLKITFDRPITDQDQYQLQFRIGARPNVLRKSLVSLSFTGLTSTGPWTATASDQEGALMVVVTPTTDALIGQYMVVVGVVLPNGVQLAPANHRHPLYLLFNAFSPDDVAFLEQQSDCGEYVLNDTGVIYMGDYPRVTRKYWNYGQFEPEVLDACIFIMDKSQMPISDRGDAVKVCRMASAMINSLDDLGVLVGNWSNDFSMGVAPTLWTGSVSILQDYHRTNKPVSYAQCWVFAGVLNTFLRCLGLASRVITNFFSAHDNNGNLRTDLVFTESMNPDHRHTRDSIWNYHCWNEVFLRRSDIPPEYSGWQVIDSTPQETSDGHFRCGPASVKAIKIGKVCFPFDGKFIFAEVNSDIIYHIRDKYGRMTTAHVDKTKVGQKIITKKPMTDEPLDLTLEYKFHEELEQAQNEAALATAESFGCLRDHTVIPPVLLSIKINSVKGYVGRPVEAQIEFVNHSNSALKAPVLVSVETIYYTGVRSKLVHRERYNQELHANSTQRMAVSVHPQKYMAALGSQPVLQITVTARLPHGRMITESSVISLEVLRLLLEAPPLQFVGQSSVVSVSFVNPLDVTLQRPRVFMEGSGLLPLQNKEFLAVEPGGELRWEVESKAYLSGSKHINAVMVTKNLYMAWGYTKVNVLSFPWGSINQK